MDPQVIVKALIALAPVFALLIVFDRLDAFNLISFRSILLLLGLGGAFAALSFVANLRVMDGFPIGFSNYSKYIAPVIEETMKAAPIIFMFANNRLGFKVDAAIAGFAVGAGFSMVENIWYLFLLTDANVSAWLVRGFGTAVMHGGTTALFAIISHEMTERQAEGEAARFTSVLAAYRLSPDVTAERLYIETMQAVLAGSNKVIIDTPDGQGVLPYLPLDALTGRGGSPAALGPADPAAPGTTVAPAR